MSNGNEKPAFISQQVYDGRYFFLDLTPSPKVELAIVCGGKERCTPTYEIDRENFPYFAIEFVAEGEGELSMNGQQYRLLPGSVFAYGPGIPFQIRSRGPKSLVKYFITFTGTSALQLSKSSGLIAKSPQQLVRTRWVHDVYEQLLESGTYPRRVARRHCLLLLRLLALRLEADARSFEETASTAFETYCRSRRYIEENYRSLAGIREVAKACKIAPAYLSRLFQRFAQEGPYQFLVRLKMDCAADLFAKAELSVGDASQALGFTDPYHFSRVFKRVHGMSPRTFSRTVVRTFGSPSNGDASSE